MCYFLIATKANAELHNRRGIVFWEFKLLKKDKIIRTETEGRRVEERRGSTTPQ